MPHPSELHQDGVLTEFIAGYSNGKYIADDVLPVIETAKASDKFQKYNRADVTTEVDLELADNGEATEVDYTITTGNYSVVDRGAKAVMSRKSIANADDPQKPREKGASNAMNKALLGREIRVAALLNTTANYASANTSAASNAWSDATNGTPLDDVSLMQESIAPGMDDDTELILILTKEKWNHLRKHPQMLGAGQLKPRLSNREAADLLEVDRIFVSNAQKNTATEGLTAVFARIWTTANAVMIRVPKTEPTDETGLFAATFRHRVDGGAGIVVRTWDEPKRGRGGSEVVQVEHSDDEVVVQNDMGYCLTGV